MTAAFPTKSTASASRFTACWADAGCVWDARTALRRAEAFADYNIGWLEEPLRQSDADGYVWLHDRSPVPIAAGEGECGRESFRALIAESGT